MLAGIFAAGNGHEVRIYEKNEKLGKKLNLKPGSLLNGFLAKTTKCFQIHKVEIVEGYKSEMVLHHKCFSK